MYQNGRELGTEFCSGIGKAFARLVFKYFDIAVVHYYDHGFGLTFGNQIIHDEVHLALVAQLVSFSPIPCCRYSTGYFWKAILIILCGV